MSLSASERETIVRWSDDPEEPLTLFTHKAKIAQKLERQGAKIIRESKIKGEVVAWTLEMPREWAKYPRKSTRKLSPEHVAKLQAARKASRESS